VKSAKVTEADLHVNNPEQKGERMKNLIEPEGVTERDLEIYSEGLQDNAKQYVRRMLDSGAGEGEIAEYMASLGPEPEDEIGAADREPPVRRKAAW